MERPAGDRPHAQSGGMHAYYAGTGQRSATIASQHLDFRAAGGYVVAPHSTVGGRRTWWSSGQPSTATVDFTAMRQLVGSPARAARVAAAPACCATALGRTWTTWSPRWASSREGDYRNGFLFWAANRVLDHDQPERLDELAAAAVAAGLPRREVDRTIRSAQQQPARTRTPPHSCTARPSWPPGANRRPRRTRGKPRPPAGKRSHPPAWRSGRWTATCRSALGPPHSPRRRLSTGHCRRKLARAALSTNKWNR